MWGVQEWPEIAGAFGGLPFLAPFHSLVAWLLPGMHVAGFWAAFWGALVVSIVSWIGSMVFGPKGRIEVRVHRD